ncbi:MAG: exopolysaccharide biosynthesis protein [Pseudomonadota bacterium]
MTQHRAPDPLTDTVSGRGGHEGASAFLLSLLRGLHARSSSDEAPSDPRSDRGEGAGDASVTLGALVAMMDRRSYGFLLLLLALPCCLPFVYVLPQLVALPMLALAAQLAAGRPHPWFPTRLANRSFAVAQFEGVISRASKYIGWFERLAYPRLTFLTEGLGVRIIGALLIIPCASILVPLPSTNTAPGIGVAIAAIGLIERDGLLVILGLLMGLAWVVLLVFLGAEGIQLLKAWLLSR